MFNLCQIDIVFIKHHYVSWEVNWNTDIVFINSYCGLPSLGNRVVHSRFVDPTKTVSLSLRFQTLIPNSDVDEDKKQKVHQWISSCTGLTLLWKPDIPHSLHRIPSY